VLTLRTVMALSTAARACLNAARLERSAFEAEHARLATCAAGLLEVRSGAELLQPRAVGVALGVEDELEIRTELPRPQRGPLTLTALALTGLGPSAGVTATFTGERSVLGQKVLRADDPTLVMPITPDCEAPGTAAIGAPKAQPNAELRALLLGTLALATLVLGAAFWRLRGSRTRPPPRAT
jgi:hypothetical protein